MAATARRDWPRYGKWLLFACMGIAAILAISADERFLLNPQDPHWKHIAPFQWLLLVHALGGVTALTVGPFQFSTRLRASHLALHRILGRVYICAVAVSAPLATYIGVTFEPSPLRDEQWAQGGLWFLCTLIAFLAIRKRNIALHRQWMVRSYAFTFIFISSRVLDAFPAVHIDLTQLTTILWYLIVAAFFLPDAYNAAAVIFKPKPLLRPNSGTPS